MRHHRTVGPPSKPGHGRGSAPYEPSDSTSRPWGGASWTVEKQRASCKSLSRLLALSAFDALWNISWIALVTSLPARALTWTLSRHRLNQPSIRRRRIEGTTSKNDELNAYGRKESFLWRHAAAATSLVFPPESTRRRTNQPTWFPRTKTRATHLKETKQLPACLFSTTKQVPLTKSILLIELVKLDLNAVTGHRASVVIFAGQVKRLNS